MEKFSVQIALILILMLITAGCTGNGLFAPTETPTSTPTEEPTNTPAPTETLAPTATLVPTATETPRPTPTDFPLSLLPGYFAFMTYECAGDYPFCTSIGIARADWSTYEIVTTHTHAMVGNPIWSPDGRYIVYDFFEMGEDGFYDLRVVDLYTKTEFSITPNHIEGYVDELSWSPDGENLVVAMGESRDANSKLYTINVSSKRMVNISGSTNAIDQHPVWSPSGDRIAFSSDRDGSLDIWTISPQGTGLTNLTGGLGDSWTDSMPSWSADGSQIAFYSFGPDSSGLWIMDADGTGPQLLFEIDSGQTTEIPVWSPDGQWIAIIFGRGTHKELWLIDPYYGEGYLVSNEAGDFSKVSWSPDSIALIYNQDLENMNTVINLEVVGVEWPFHMEMETSLEDVVWSPVESLH